MTAEPVAIAAAVRAIILAAVGFGLDWTVDQVAALMLAVEAVLALVVRQSVTPNPSVRARVRGDKGQFSPLWIVVIVVLLLLILLVVNGNLKF